MNRLLSCLLLLSSSLVFSGCGSESPVVGTWQLDVDKTFQATPALEAMVPESLPAEQREQGLARMRQQMGSMTLEFKPDGTCAFTGGQGPKTGTYSTEGNEIKIDVKDDDDGPDKITFTDDEIRMEGTNNGMTMTMVFGRKAS